MQDIIIEAVQMGVILPLVISLVAVGVIRFSLGGLIGKDFAVSAIAIGTMAGIIAMDSWPSFPPISATQKFPYLVLFGLIVGVVIDQLGRHVKIQHLLISLWSIVVVCWIGWRQLIAMDPVSIINLALIAIMGVAVLWHLHEEPGTAPTVPVSLIVACIGAAVIAFIGQSSSITQLYGALAAAIGGYVLWNWPTARFTFGCIGLVSAGGAFLALTTILIQFTETYKLALFFIVPVFFCPTFVRRTRFAKNEATATVTTSLFSTVPVIFAIALAILAESNII